MAGVMPNHKVEIAFDSGFATPIASRTYTDVTAYVDLGAGLELTYGRGDERSTPDPGSLSLTLGNKDGRFTPEKASGAYYPNVKLGKPIKVSVQYNGVWYVRYTGYIDEWPLTWPTGSDVEANITLSCSTRRARLGQEAPLQFSPIRMAYVLPDLPQAYWTMIGTLVATNGVEIFIDATNIGTPVEDANTLAVYTSTVALQPVFDESTPGPVDESSLLKFPRYTDAGLIGTRPHYVGAGGACKVNTGGELTLELVARVDANMDGQALVTLFELQGTGGFHRIVAYVSNLGYVGTESVGFEMDFYDTDWTLLHYEDSDLGIGYRPDMFALVNDGELHHYAFTLTGGNVGKLYVDGTLLGTLTFPGPYVYDQDFTGIVLGADTLNADAWIGHVAIRDEALTGTEIAAHAAAVVVNEDVEERLQRLFGYMGVPTAEVSAEVSPAIDVGPQAQVGRSSAEIADEMGNSTAGILYDKRDGTTTMQARSHRYNQTSAFTLSSTLQEYEGDLAPVLDARFLVNYVTVTRSNTEDTPYWKRDVASEAEYGTHSTTIEMVTTSWEEAKSAADHALFRYATPKVRVATVSVDVVDLSTAQQALVLAADVGTLFNIALLPAQAPTTPLPLYLEGYSESINAEGHTITMNTTPGDLFTNVAVLNDAAHDVLGSGIVLAY